VSEAGHNKFFIEVLQMAGFRTYELIVLSDWNEFNQDLLDKSNNGQVPIYLADVCELVSNQGGDVGINLIAVSVGKPIDPEELQAKINEYIGEPKPLPVSATAQA
jgi:hypothetical protein